MLKVTSVLPAGSLLLSKRSKTVGVSIPPHPQTTAQAPQGFEILSVCTAVSAAAAADRLTDTKYFSFLLSERQKLIFIQYDSFVFVVNFVAKTY